MFSLLPSYMGCPAVTLMKKSRKREQSWTDNSSETASCHPRSHSPPMYPVSSVKKRKLPIPKPLSPARLKLSFLILEGPSVHCPRHVTLIHVQMRWCYPRIPRLRGEPEDELLRKTHMWGEKMSFHPALFFVLRNFRHWGFRNEGRQVGLVTRYIGNFLAWFTSRK